MLKHARMQVRPLNISQDDDAAALKRLHEAVHLGGGNKNVSARTGLALRSLSNYLAGREMRKSALVAISDACGVNLEWLLAGRGPRERIAPDRQARISEPFQPLVAPRAQLDPHALAKAIEIVEALSAAAGQTVSPVQMARRIINTYELLTAPDEEVPPLPQLPEPPPK